MARRGWRRQSLGGLFSNIMDSTHDYVDDWTDRFDDFEYDMRDAFDDVIDDRDYYYDRPSSGRRYEGGYEGPSRRPLPERRPEAVQGLLEDAGLKELAAKVESLTKTVEKLAKVKQASA